MEKENLVEIRVLGQTFTVKTDAGEPHIQEVADAFGHPICGTVESLRRMRAPVVRAFLRRHFVPGRMTLGVSGGIPLARLRRAVARAFPRRGANAAGRPRRPPVERTGRMRLRHADLPQAYLVRLTRAPSDHRRQLALQVALEIVGADPDARLFQEVRERLGLGYDVGASLEVGLDWAATIISASAARDQERRVVDTDEHTCQDATRGFSESEMRRAHRKLRYASRASRTRGSIARWYTPRAHRWGSRRSRRPPRSSSASSGPKSNARGGS